jgi:hypothetical protein
MIRGPQPETARDYTLSAPGWQVRERGNSLRKRVYRLETPLVTDTLRLTVEATHGCPQAKVFEVRVYSGEEAGPA